MSEIGHSDAPVSALRDDHLGIAPYAEALANFIRRCDTPMTVAIQGDWGTGKTSLMYMVQESLGALKTEKRIETVWFATWQYAQFGATAALPVSLLSTLLRRIGGEDKSLLNSGLTALKKLAKPALNVGLRVATAGAVEADDLASLGGADPIDLACNAEELKQEIAKLVRGKRNKGADRIVIFVDDLDRVPPERAVDILETIKLFVDLEGCVFVLALDYAVVRRGLKQKFDVGEDELGGRSFFDKIIQLPFSIPTARYETDRFISSLFKRMSMPMGEDDAELFANLARWSLSANPRGLKRVFNSLQLLIGMARAQTLITGDARSDRLMMRNLFALLCMQNRFEIIHDWLIVNAQSLDAPTLQQLAGAVEEGEAQQPRAAEAIKSLNEGQSQDFVGFAPLFVQAIQDPESDNEEIDGEELDRLRGALTLTRVTSVSEVPSAVTHNDPDFRAHNRELMRHLKDALEQNEGEHPHRLRVIQPHSDSGVYLTRKIDQEGQFDLWLYHGETHADVSLNSSKRQIRGRRADIHAALPLDYSEQVGSSDSKIILWRHDFDDISITGHEEFLNQEGKLRFCAVERALTGKLG